MDAGCPEAVALVLWLEELVVFGLEEEPPWVEVGFEGEPPARAPPLALALAVAA